MSPNNRINKPLRAVEGDWRRVDLHLHTPASADWLEPGASYLQWLQKAESRGLQIVAITDHNTVEGITRLRAEIERLAWLEANDRLRPQERRDLDEYRRIGDKLLVLPGFEFTATFGFHVLGIFPPETPVRNLELLLLRLNVPVEKLAEGSTEVGVTSDVQTAYRLIREAGGLAIAAHANSAHGVAMRGLTFGGQTKMAYTQDPNLHALEVTDLDSTSRRATAHFFDGTKPEYPRQMHCIQGSDAHRLTADPKDKNRTGIGDRVTEMCLSDISFEALKSVFEGQDFGRIRPYRLMPVAPYDPLAAAREQGNTVVQSFHETMASEGGRLNHVLADVVALANTQGGTVYLGVSASRKGTPRGIGNVNEAIATLRREIERRIAPVPDVRFEIVQSLGVSVLCVNVANGTDKPYAFERTRIYVRVEGETADAVRDEIVQLVLSQRPREFGIPVPVPAGARQMGGNGQPEDRSAQPEQRGGQDVRPPGEVKPSSGRGRRRQPRAGSAEQAPRPPRQDIPGRTRDPEPATVPASAGPLLAPGTREDAVAVPVAEASPRMPVRTPEVGGLSPLAEPVAEPPVVTPEVTSEAIGGAGEASPVVREATGVHVDAGQTQTASQEVAPAPAGLKSDTAALVEREAESVETADEAEPAAEAAAEAVLPVPDPSGAPSIGVEVLGMEERRGRRYFMIRDLRTGSVVQNVTPGSARRLWSYAINQQLTNPVDPGKVVWSGDFGLWQVTKRTRGVRYDLAMRQADGPLRIFYGVTAEGMHGPWQEFLSEEKPSK